MASDWTAVISTAATNASGTNGGVKVMAALTAGSNRELVVRRITICNDSASTEKLQWRLLRQSGAAGSGGTSISVAPQKVNPSTPETADFTIAAVTAGWGTNPSYGGAVPLLTEIHPSNYPTIDLKVDGGLSEPGVTVAPGTTLLLECTGYSTNTFTPAITFTIAQ